MPKMEKSRSDAARGKVVPSKAKPTGTAITRDKTVETLPMTEAASPAIWPNGPWPAC